MRTGSLVLLVVAACTGQVGGTRRDAAADEGVDARAATDSGATTPDLGTPDTGAADLGAPDLGAPDLCVPTRTSCNPALECGAIPDGCGTYDCGTCGDGVTIYCATLTSDFRDGVYTCVQNAQRDHPEWFDPTMFRDTSSWLVLDASATAYVAYVAMCAQVPGSICIPDPNAPGNEVRCRHDPGDLAENIQVRTYGTGRTVGRYTSTCTPAGF